MWTSVIVSLGIALAQAPSPAPVPEADTGFDVAGLVAPILSTGVVGVVLIMVLFKVKLMPSYVYDDMLISKDAEISRLSAETDDLKTGLKDAQKVYTEQVIPTLTRVLDAERELVDLRREEAVDRRRRGEP